MGKHSMACHVTARTVNSLIRQALSQQGSSAGGLGPADRFAPRKVLAHGGVFLHMYAVISFMCVHAECPG